MQCSDLVELSHICHAYFLILERLPWKVLANFNDPGTKVVPLPVNGEERWGSQSLQGYSDGGVYVFAWLHVAEYMDQRKRRLDGQ